MECSNLIVIFIVLILAVGAAHAALPPELYWKSNLPNTPMPKAITDLLNPALQEAESPNVTVGSGGNNGVNVNTGKNKPGGPSVSVGGFPFKYIYAASETQLHHDPNVALFFLEKDLHRGRKFDLHFTKSANEARFLPRQVADSIPFSSNRLGDILNKFDVKPASDEARNIKNTINECEEQGIEGEKKYCATSLESMVDFVTSKLARNVGAISTEVVEKENKLQEYTVAKGVKKLPEDKVVVCHKLNYPYAVFYCHQTDTTKAYSVPLEGVDGSRMKAVAVCHTDTSKWNPKHLAFLVLKVKPGSFPVCHFLPKDHIVWVPKRNT